MLYDRTLHGRVFSFVDQRRGISGAREARCRIDRSDFIFPSDTDEQRPADRWKVSSYLIGNGEQKLKISASLSIFIPPDLLRQFHILTITWNG